MIWKTNWTKRNRKAITARKFSWPNRSSWSSDRTPTSRWDATTKTLEDLFKKIYSDTNSVQLLRQGLHERKLLEEPPRQTTQRQTGRVENQQRQRPPTFAATGATSKRKWSLQTRTERAACKVERGNRKQQVDEGGNGITIHDRDVIVDDDMMMMMITMTVTMMMMNN